MDWVVFWFLLGLGLLNLLGVGMFHYRYAHEEHEKVWYKDSKFWSWTAFILVVGASYVGVRLVEYVLMRTEEK